MMLCAALHFRVSPSASVTRDHTWRTRISARATLPRSWRSDSISVSSRDGAGPDRPRARGGRPPPTREAPRSARGRRDTLHAKASAAPLHAGAMRQRAGEAEAVSPPAPVLPPTGDYFFFPLESIVFSLEPFGFVCARPASMRPGPLADRARRNVCGRGPPCAACTTRHERPEAAARRAGHDSRRDSGRGGAGMGRKVGMVMGGGRALRRW